MATDLKSQQLHPYQRAENLGDYVQNATYHLESGWINGMVLFRGRYYSESEFNDLFPRELKMRAIQLDGTQLK